ncbi:MAG: DUF4926 domain-containing protein [Synechococcaceae cyanobacterium SM2_3_2]|nr:DUF4926 domain-containing protein [Synechococcaceae cyanobacterium SM2_3_2]
MKMLDVVALIEDYPKANLKRGQVGTIVEDYGDQVFEVEFVDLDGRTYAVETLAAQQLIQLLHQPVEAA